MDEISMEDAAVVDVVVAGIVTENVDFDGDDAVSATPDPEADAVVVG